MNQQYCSFCGTDLSNLPQGNHCCTGQVGMATQGGLSTFAVPCPACATKDAEIERLKAEHSECNGNVRLTPEQIQSGLQLVEWALTLPFDHRDHSRTANLGGLRDLLRGMLNEPNPERVKRERISDAE